MPPGYEPPTPDPPARLGRFTVVRRLGAGGMAEVFLARSRGAEGTDKLLVVKRILPAFAANSRFRAMFIDEAKVALRLNHPNIVQVYGFESDGPSLLLVMEHIDGVDLSALMHGVHGRGEKIPHGLAAWIGRELARGLHYAHERTDEDGSPLDIVHRDVSPGNVLISHEGIVKLGDFGIAKARTLSGEDEGAIKGKFAYMPPEQARAEVVDRRADVYSLGIVLGEMLAGRSLFEGVGAGMDLLPRLRKGDTPKVDTVLADVPQGLREIVGTMLAPERTQRFSSAREVAEALSRFLRVQHEEWDNASLEQYLARYVVRPPPAVAVSEPSGKDAVRDAPTVPRGGPSRGPMPSRPPPTLDTSALLRERVHVAVLVGRVVLPTSTLDTVDTRALMDLVESLAFKADATLERHDDGHFVILVGVTRPHVDHALRAARLALDLSDAASALAADAPELTPGLAMGLARGMAAAARGASGSLLGWEVVDDAVSFATALAAGAVAGETLVAGGLYRLVRRAFVLTEHGGRASVGSRIWRLERAKSKVERERELRGDGRALVGRVDELRALTDALERAQAGPAGSGLLVIGELGVGKSALLVAFQNDVAARVTTLRVPVAFGGSEEPYRCATQILNEVLEIADGAHSDRATLDLAIERAVEIASIRSPAGIRAARRALRVAYGLEEDAAAGEGATPRELVLVLRRLLAARALMNPLVLLVDGVELADRSSRRVLTELVTRPPVGPVLVILAMRDDDPLSREIVGVPVVVVAPLPAGVRGELLAARLGVDEVTDELLREVSAVAGGNPLMLLEVIEALGDRGRLEFVADDQRSRATLIAAREGELPLPATLEEVLAARLDALPQEARTIVRWCALLESEIAADVLDTLGGDEAPRALTRLVSDGILVRARGRAETYAFAHTALAKVARASVDPTLVPAMHARIAAALERRPEARGVGARTVARHREAAGAIRPAARAYLEAAMSLRNASRNPESLEAYARVLELTNDASDPEGSALRFTSHLGREDIARSVGRTRARRAELMAMRAIAVESKDPRLVARALARQARYKLDTGLGAGIERDVAAVTRAARRAGELRTEAEAKRILAIFLSQRGRYAEAMNAAEEALSALETRSAVAAPPGGTAEDGIRAARVVRVETLLAKGVMLRQTGQIASAIETYAEVLAIVSRHGPRGLLARVLNSLGVACFSRGDYADALRLYLSSIAVDREIGHRDRLGVALSNAGQTFAVLGDIDRAIAFLRKAVEVFAVVGGRSTGSADAHVALAELYAERGEIEQALAEVERARTDADATGSRYDMVRVRLGEAAVALARHEDGAALLHAEEAERLASNAGLVAYAIHARAYAARAAAAAGDAAAARRYVDAVLSDSHFADPMRTERGEMVLAACERALRAVGDHARADTLGALRKKALGAARPSSHEVRA